MTFEEAIEDVGKVVDALGVAAIVAGIVVSAALALRPAADRYRTFRQRLGRGILVGLELLVAADIIRTVAVEPTLESVSVLAIIVLVRTFLSFSLEVELNGRWPWQHRPDEVGPAGDRA